jgi:cysteinyl-tRNA synthetase
MRTPALLRAVLNVVLLLACLMAAGASCVAAAPARPSDQLAQTTPPAPRPAVRPKASVPAKADTATAVAARARLIGAVRSWAVQMQDLDPAAAQAAPVDLFVTDATSGAKGGVALTKGDVAALKIKPDGSRRLAISYLSIGEAEDYRTDYFGSEYMTEDAPDWLMKENRQWKGNRIIRFCEEGWQRTILGDDDGRNVYNSLDPSPLYQLIEMGFDGVYLDRVDVYSEVTKECPDAARQMVDFVARLAAHAHKKNPNFLTILQNAEELLQDPKMVATIDAVAKEDLFYGADHSESENDAVMIKTVIANLERAKSAGRPILVLDYLADPQRRAADKARIENLGFIPYFGPRKLNQLWLPGANF